MPITRFLNDEAGTDLVEYTLLLAAVALAGAAAYVGMASSSNLIWSITNTRLASAAAS